ncbi:OmpH family outer membrane protein [Candidatus Pelagibacter sp. HIMB1746]|uniref:OmpH family outer membrane protein n=1 Tax=Candidatus Pelagibacter sp. HIMB1746 TaxID=3413370 RepID=UPI003F87AEDE
MKKILFFIIILSNFFFISLSKASIGYIDINFILQNSVKGKKIIDELNSLKKNNEKLFNSKKKELDLKRVNLNKIKNITPENEYQEKISELKKNIDEFNSFQNDKILLFEKLKKEKLDNFFVYLDEILSNYIASNKLKIVIDKKDIIIADDSLDITKDILILTNKQ